MSRIALAGGGLTALWTLVAVALWDRRAAMTALAFGAGATLIQAAALALVRPVRTAPTDRFMARWGVGMGLRFAGVVALAVAASLWRQQVPAIPAALGYLGVLIPLLVVEVRLVR